MRIRSIKPDFWRSDDITCLEWDARLIFIGLWSYVDDNGVGRDRLADIAADLFAHDLEEDPRDTFARVSRGLQTLSDAGRITRYKANGRRFLHITNWDKHQRIDRPNKERYPLPTCENIEIATPSRDSREDSATGTEEQRNRGTEEQRKVSTEVETIRGDVEDLCIHLVERIAANGSKRPTITKAWRDAARLMLDKDGRTFEEVRGCIDWCQTDDFWRANILSMPKLREKYDQLRLQAQAKQPKKRNDIDWDAAFARAAARDGGIT